MTGLELTGEILKSPKQWTSKIFTALSEPISHSWSFKLFISEAYAQAASGAAAQPGGLESMFSSFGVMILIFAVFWFLLIRPQQKRQKEHKKMIDALTTGNEVITAGGICGKIVAADENYINLQIAAVDDKPVVITFQRIAIQAVLPKGTVKF